MVVDRCLRHIGGGRRRRLPGARWWRRGVSLLAIPLTLLAALVALNTWVGYYPTVQAAWGAISAGPLPNEVDMSDLAGLRNSNPATGKLVPVDIPADASGFKHRGEYVYLPPAWFAGETPPRLPVVMMIAGNSILRPTGYVPAMPRR